MPDLMIEIREMLAEDYDEVRLLWESIKGFRIREIDDDREHVRKFIERNKGISPVALYEGRIVGALLAGHDGREAGFYHVCVSQDFRRRGIGEKMVEFSIDRLKDEGISRISLIAFRDNFCGSWFWESLGWTKRSDVNRYELVLNAENTIKIV